MRVTPRGILICTAAALCLLAIIIGGVWYGFTGVNLISLLPGRGARTDPGDGLPALYLDLSPETYQALYDQWQSSMRAGVPSLRESDWMQGEIELDGETFPVVVWLQEESPQQWQDTKWSLRIKLDAPATVLEMRSFVARSPATHRSLDEWLYSQILRDVGVLAPRYVYAHLWMNGDDWGVYALQETLSDAFFETQQRPLGVGLYVDDSLLGRQQAQRAAASPGNGVQAVAGQWPGFVRVDEALAAQIDGDTALQEQYAAAVGLLKGFQSGLLAPAQVFDVEQLGRYLAHAQWWGARYGARFEGERYAYRALTSRLEPIGGGVLPLDAAYAQRPGLAQYVDLEVMQAYVREVERIAQPETIETLQATYGALLTSYQAALAREFPSSELNAPWRMLSERQAILRRSLAPQESVHAYSPDQESTSGHIYVANLLTYPVILDALRVGERTVPIERGWIADDPGALLDAHAASGIVLYPLHGTIPRYIHLRLSESVQRELWPRDALSDEPVQLITHIAGLPETIVTEVQRDLPSRDATAMPVRPTLQAALAQHPFLAASERPGFLRLESGDWNVTGDLVLPAGYGLLASGPVHLRFDTAAILLANGPLLFYGSKEGEIHLVPKEHNWGGIVVLEADDEMPSSLSYVTIRGTSGVQRNGWSVPGGAMFYQSPVTLSHCRLLDTIAPAALYVVQTHFECEESEFGFASAQALRASYAEGRVLGCAFHDVFGNAIAAHGSRLDVRDSSVVRVFEQGIWARQNSVIAVRGGYVRDVGVALASSSGSHIQADGVSVTRASTAGLAAYTGELGGSPASVHATEVTFKSQYDVPALVQPGSSVRLDGVAASTKALDTERLSWRQGITTTIRSLGYRLGPAIRLTGYELASQEIAAGDPLQITLYWHTNATPDRDYTVFVHIWDAAGERVAGGDSMPRQNTYPTTQWQAGQIVDDRHVVPLDLDPGEYRVALGMYHLASGQRLPVYEPDDTPVAGDSILLALGFRVN